MEWVVKKPKVYFKMPNNSSLLAFHWRPSDLHIFYKDPSLIKLNKPVFISSQILSFLIFVCYLSRLPRSLTKPQWTRPPASSRWSVQGQPSRVQCPFIRRRWTGSSAPTATWCIMRRYVCCNIQTLSTIISTDVYCISICPPVASVKRLELIVA